jgi:hypothetical protein
MGGMLKGLFGSLVRTPTSGAGPQQPLSLEHVLHDEAKPIHDVNLSDSLERIHLRHETNQIPQGFLNP